MPYKICQCEAYGCGQSLQGYRLQGDATFRRHRRAQTELETKRHARQQKLDEETRINALRAVNNHQSLESTSSSYQHAPPSPQPSIDPSLDTISSDESALQLENGAEYMHPSPRSPSSSGHVALSPEPEGRHFGSASPPSSPRQEQDGSGDHHNESEDEPPQDEPPEAESGGSADRLDNSSGLPAAYSESPPVRLAYLHAIAAQILDGATYEAANDRLRGDLELIRLCHGALPEYPVPATTVVTAKRRFNLLADDCITTKPICSECFRPYTLEEIELMQSPECLERSCKKGKVYREKRTRPSGLEELSGTSKRVPVKILAYSSLVDTIQRFLLRPDFYNNLVDTKDRLDRPPIDDDTVLSDIHDGEAWATRYVGLERTIDEDGSVRDIERQPGSRRNLLRCVLGLSITLNMDWWGATVGRSHSAGAIYGVFNDLPRAIRYLPQNVWCLTIPGPLEPSLEQLNYILLGLKDDLLRLYEGVKMRTAGSMLLKDVNAIAAGQASDLPASRKMAGSAGHSHHIHVCNFCYISLDEINKPSGYDIGAFKMRDDFEQLRNAFQSLKAKSKAARKRILDASGARWTEMNHIPGWLPISSSPLDFMHNFYGQVKGFWYTVITDGYLLDASMWSSFEDIINNSIWPSHIGRLPDNLSKNHVLQKADQWRRLCNVQPTVLWMVWRNRTTNKIRQDAPEVPRQAASPPTFDRNLEAIYRMALYLSCAERILAVKSITLYDVKRGLRYLQQFCLLALNLKIHLVQNNHLAMHYDLIIRLFGPVYAYWLFAFERFNGIMKKTNLNGHAGGEMELTLLRSWIEKQLLYDLAVNAPKDLTEPELALIKKLGRMATSNRKRGTLETDLSSFTHHGHFRAEVAAKYLDLRTIEVPELYRLLIEYLNTRYMSDGITIVHDLTNTTSRTTIPLPAGRSAKKCTSIHRGGARFGAFYASRTDNDRYACAMIDNVYLPCEMLYHLEITVPGKDPILCTVVRALECQASHQVPLLPWDICATDLGVFVAHVDTYGPLTVINSDSIMSAVALFDVPMADRPSIRVIHPLDRTGDEYDDGMWDEEGSSEI